MKLLTDEIRKKLPALNGTEGKGYEAIAQVKFFTPDSCWTWYGIEFDGEDTFWGYVIGFEPEFGYFSLSELEAVTGLLGLQVERDLNFKPKAISKLR